MFPLPAEEGLLKRSQVMLMVSGAGWVGAAKGASPIWSNPSGSVLEFPAGSLTLPAAGGMSPAMRSTLPGDCLGSVLSRRASLRMASCDLVYSRRLNNHVETGII